MRKNILIAGFRAGKERAKSESVDAIQRFRGAESKETPQFQDFLAHPSSTLSNLLRLIDF